MIYQNNTSRIACLTPWIWFLTCYLSLYDIWITVKLVILLRRWYDFVQVAKRHVMTDFRHKECSAKQVPNFRMLLYEPLWVRSKLCATGSCIIDGYVVMGTLVPRGAVWSQFLRIIVALSPNTALLLDSSWNVMAHGSRRMRWTGHVAHMGEERGVYRVLVGKPEGRRPLGRPRRRWVDNIRMDLQEVGCGYMDWIGLAQDRDRWRTLVSAVMNLRVPWNAGNFLTSCKQVSFSRRTLHHGVSK